MTLLERSSAPAALPVSVAEIKAQARIDHDDDDALIGVLIDAAVGYVDATGALGRAMITQTWHQWVSAAPGLVRLDLGPFQTLDAVHYYDADGVLQEADLEAFETRRGIDAVILRPKDGAAWPPAQWRDDAIRITYTVGFGDAAGDVPATVRQAIRLLVAHWYERREAAGDAAMTETPLGFRALLQIERNGWYG